MIRWSYFSGPFVLRVKPTKPGRLDTETEAETATETKTERSQEDNLDQVTSSLRE